MKSHIFGSLILFLLLALSGCVAPRAPGDPRVHIANSLRNSIEVVAVDYGTSGGETKVVQVTIRNRTTRTVRIDYKIDWLAGDGSAITTILSKWTNQHVIAGEIATLKEVAPNQRAQSFRIQIIKGR